MWSASDYKAALPGIHGVHLYLFSLNFFLKKNILTETSVIIMLSLWGPVALVVYSKLDVYIACRLQKVTWAFSPHRSSLWPGTSGMKCMHSICKLRTAQVYQSASGFGLQLTLTCLLWVSVTCYISHFTYSVWWFKFLCMEVSMSRAKRLKASLPYCRGKFCIFCQIFQRHKPCRHYGIWISLSDSARYWWLSS